MRVFLAGVAAAACGLAAVGGQPEEGAAPGVAARVAGVGDAVGGGHGWMVFARGSDRAAVIHVPPWTGREAAGTCRLVRWFTRVPERVAWSGDRVYFAFRPEDSWEAGGARRVLGLRAERVRGGLGWRYLPAERAEALPSLPAGVELLGFAGVASGAAALVRGAGGGNEGVALLLLRDGTWRETALPWHGSGAISPGDTLGLISTEGGVGVLVRPAAGSIGEWWRGEIVEAGGGGVVGVEWSVSRRAVGEVGRGTRELAEHAYWVNGELVGVAYAEGRIRLTRLLEGEMVPMAEVEAPTEEFRVAPVAEGGLVLLGWMQSRGTKGGGKGDEELRLVGVGVPEGREVYAAVAKQEGPIGIRELQIISAVLVSAMLAVLLVVLRPAGGGSQEWAKRLPKGVEPAEGMRRGMATLVDAGLVSAGVMMAMRVRLTEVADASFYLDEARGVQMVMWCVAVGWIQGTAFEWRFGRTPGKWLMGFRVMALERGGRGGGTTVEREEFDRGVSLWRSGARNVVKWVPPMTVAVVLWPGSRHLGDLVAGTAVVDDSGVERPMEPPGE